MTFAPRARIVKQNPCLLEEVCAANVERRVAGTGRLQPGAGTHLRPTVSRRAIGTCKADGETLTGGNGDWGC